MKSLGVMLEEGIEQDDLAAIHLKLDSELKYLHSKNYCVDNVNFFTIVQNEEDVITFLGIRRINDSEPKGDITKSNIRDLVNTMLGAYGYNMSKQSGLNVPIRSFDYSSITKQYPNFIISNYEVVKMAIPNIEENEGYYNDYINGNIVYYSDYIGKNREALGGKSSSRKYVKATEAGKLYAKEEDDSEKKAAFINAITYPLLIASFLLLAFFLYLMIIIIRS